MVESADHDLAGLRAEDALGEDVADAGRLVDPAGQRASRSCAPLGVDARRRRAPAPRQPPEGIAVQVDQVGVG